jgi:hypothetical protein
VLTTAVTTRARPSSCTWCSKQLEEALDLATEHSYLDLSTITSSGPES